MKQEIRLRRLYAFFNSKVLNVLLLMGIMALLLIGHAGSILLPPICAATAFALFIGYSLWIWIAKPKRITINVWISNSTIWFTLYYLVAINFTDLTWWWFAILIVAAIILCFIDMVSPHDQSFDI